jgi:hypothetical protein
MATIITKNSQTASAVPLASSLEVGELAVNTADGKLYTEHTGGVVKEIIPSTVVDNGITTDKIANNAVTVPKINATGTPSSSTFLRGDGAWQPAAAAALSAGFTLSAGASVVANTAVSLKSDGTVSSFTAPPSSGTTTTNFSGQDLTGLSEHFATRGLYSTFTGTSNYNVTLRGFYVSGTGKTDGSSVNIGTAPSSFYSFGYSTYHDTQTEGVFYLIRGGIDQGFENTTFFGVATATVDSSGNVSVGSIGTDRRSTLGTGTGGVNITQIVDNLFYVSSGNSSFVVFPKTAGNPSFYSNKSSEIGNLGASGQTFFANNSSHILRLRSNGTATVCSWNGSSIGSPTQQTLLLGSSCVWTMNAARTRAFALYREDGSLKVAGFTVNATTGLLTFVSSYTYQRLDGQTNTNIKWISDTYLVVTAGIKPSNTAPTTNYHIAFQIDAAGNVLNAGSRISAFTQPTFRLNSDFIAQGDSTGASRITWSPASTTGWVNPNVGGFAQTTTSTSPATIVIAGVMTGFTGLVPGSKYYLSDALDGTISTTVPVLTFPTELGRAVNSTDLKVYFLP